jgi:pimeloyl-ACP methyl ester carboxylesterase
VQPETRYARCGDLSIAYQVLGDGPRDLVFVPGIVSHVEFFHELPGYTEFLRGLAAFARVIVFDKRGNGLSDRVVGAPSLEERMEDIRAVMHAVGSERAALLGVSEGGPLSLVFAATYPERVDAIVLYETFVRFGGTSDYPFGPPRDRHSEITATMTDWHGTGISLWIYGAHHRDDPRVQALWGRAERLSASPGGARALFEMLGDMDVRGVLPSVRVPCLVIHGASGSMGSMFVDHGRYLAEHLADARLVVLEGIDHYPWFANADAIVAEVEEFLTGARHAREPDRALATVLFTDIVGSTARAAEMGDQRWRDLLAHHHALVRRELGRFRGREVKTVGDGFLATFDGPARAIRCACAIREGVRPLGIEIRAGLHTGECELMGDDVGGIAVHIGARVAASAAPSEVLVSSTVKDLVAGSGLRFADRGTHDLRGVPGEWRLFAVEG